MAQKKMSMKQVRIAVSASTMQTLARAQKDMSSAGSAVNMAGDDQPGPDAKTLFRSRR